MGIACIGNWAKVWVRGRVRVGVSGDWSWGVGWGGGGGVRRRVNGGVLTATGAQCVRRNG